MSTSLIHSRNILNKLAVCSVWQTSIKHISSDWKTPVWSLCLGFILISGVIKASLQASEQRCLQWCFYYTAVRGFSYRCCQCYQLINGTLTWRQTVGSSVFDQRNGRVSFPLWRFCHNLRQLHLATLTALAHIRRRWQQFNLGYPLAPVKSRFTDFGI